MRILAPLLAILLTDCTAVPPTLSPPMPTLVFEPTPMLSDAVSPPPSPARTPIPGLQPVFDAGLNFLKGKYNAEHGLLQESPNIGQHRYYLTNDNALAAYVFEQLGETEMAQRLRVRLEAYGYQDNDFIETAWGEVTPWPPRHHKDIVVQTFGEGECDFLDKEETGPVTDCVLQV